MLEDLRAADVTTPAVVLKLDPNVLHHGGLGVIRSLGRLGVPVHGVHEGRWAPAASSRYLAGRVFWQPPADDVDRITAGLLGLASRIGRPAVLLPTDDAGAIFLAGHGGPLRDSFLFADPPAELPRQVAGKYSLFQLCRDLGVPSPRATMAWSAGEAADFAATAGLPVIGKLTNPWRAVSRPWTRGSSAQPRAAGGPRYSGGSRRVPVAAHEHRPDGRFLQAGEKA